MQKMRMRPVDRARAVDCRAWRRNCSLSVILAKIGFSDQPFLMRARRETDAGTENVWENTAGRACNGSYCA